MTCMSRRNAGKCSFGLSSTLPKPSARSSPCRKLATGPELASAPMFSSDSICVLVEELGTRYGAKRTYSESNAGETSKYSCTCSPSK
jgi:hypothetical protein